MRPVYLDICSHCGHRIPKEEDVERGMQIPCSPYHVRCVRCNWPVAKTLVTQDGLCYLCMDGNTRRNYNRKNGRLLYGAVDGSTDPKDYLMNGRMRMHGDEEQLLAVRRTKSRPIREDKLAKLREQEAAAAQQKCEQEAAAAQRAQEQAARQPPPLKPAIDEARWVRGLCQNPQCTKRAVNKPYCSTRCHDQHRWEYFQAMEMLREEQRHANVTESTH